MSRFQSKRTEAPLLSLLLISAVLCIPSASTAFSLAEVQSVVSLILLAFIGAFGAAALLIFAISLGYYLALYPLEDRTTGIIGMGWGVVTLFVVVCLIGILNLIT